VISRVERTTALTRLDDDRHRRQRGDDSIPLWERTRASAHAWRILRDHERILAEQLVELAMSSGIGDIDAGSQDSNSPTTNLQRSTMRSRIDAPRHSAHDRYASSHQRSGNRARHPQSIRSRVSCTDDRDNRRPKHVCVANRVQTLGRIREIIESPGILRVSPTPNHGLRQRHNLIL
jgi:hypothetical protein